MVLEDVPVAVLVPALVDVHLQPQGRGAGRGGFQLAPQPPGHHPVGVDSPPLQAGDQRLGLGVATLGEQVVIGRAKRRLGVADQEDGGHEGHSMIRRR